MRPKKLLKIVVAIAAVGCMIFFIPWKLVGLWITPLPATVQEQVNDAVDKGLDGIIVYVDGDSLTQKLYTAGWQDRAHKVPADPHALFKIASISKLYIAVAVAKLASNNVLSLDKTLAKYLPEYEGRIDYADKITLSMMLQHRSGIPDYINSPDLPWSDLPANANAFLDLVLDKDADFKPGSRYQYSNTNYLLIGIIMDKVLGYSHREYIKREILEPLKLTNTFGLLSEVSLNKVMGGHYIGYDGDLKAQNYVSPGGSMIATATDVGIFLRALNNGSLLNSKEQVIYSKIYKYEHTGLLPGYSSIARYHKDIDKVVIQFVNTSGGDSWAISELVYNRIIRILRKQSIKAKRPGK